MNERRCQRAIGGRAERGGFTLIELLCVIAILGALVILSVPALRGSRQAARATVSVGNCRTHVAALTAYANDYQEFWPALTDPKASLSVIWYGDFPVQIGYFWVHSRWHLVLAEPYYNSSPFAEVFHDPYGGTAGDSLTEYYYSHTFLTRPEFWARETRTGPQQWGPTRVGDVLYPDRKGLVVSGRAYENPVEPERLIPAGFVDGSAEARSLDRWNRYYVGGTGNWPGYFIGYLHGAPEMHTIDGVRGRDRE